MQISLHSPAQRRLAQRLLAAVRRQTPAAPAPLQQALVDLPWPEFLHGFATLLGMRPPPGLHALPVLEGAVDAIFAWPLAGFPARRESAATLSNLLRLLAAWLLHRSKGTTRRAEAWKLLTAGAVVLGLHDLAASTACGRTRLILRAARPEVQSALLRADWAYSAWRGYVAASRTVLYDSAALEEQAVVYCLWPAGTSEWYVGKARCTRRTGLPRAPFSGPARRFREHASKTLAGDRSALRYRRWCDTPPHRFRLAFVASGPEP